MAQQLQFPQLIIPSRNNLDKIENMEKIDVFEYIYFSRKLIERYILPSKRKEELINRIESIEKRAKDPYLYLAIVGEFSSGKSTFINGMLRQRLLKSACIATTASATYIKSGKEFIVTASFVDGETIKATKSDSEKLEYKLYKIKPDLDPKSIDLNYLLDLLTSEQSVADKINRIDIEVPSIHLVNNVSIIDTPGINAAAEHAEKHEKITQDVVDNVADAAIILIPSSSPMTATLINFLDTKARHFLHRCIFVVTAMDKQFEEERNDIIDFVKLKLADKLDLSDPIVLQSSAITMVPVKNIPTSMQNSWGYWQNQFNQLEAALWQTTLRQREIIISESLIRLLQELIKELNGDLEEKKKQLASKEKLLKKSSVEAIEKVMDVLYDDSKERIKNDLNILRKRISSKKNYHRTLARTEISKIITNSGADILSYEEKLAPKIKLSIEKEALSYSENANDDMFGLRETCSDIRDNFAKQFKANYCNFPFLGINLTPPSLPISAIAIPKLQFSSSKNYLANQESKDASGAKKGALGWATVGLFLGGPVGAALGAVAGGFAGYIFAGDSLDERRKKVCDFVNNDVDAFFDAYTKEVETNLETITKPIFSQLKNSCENHVKEYGEKVKILITAHKNEENQLKAEIQQINSDILELSKLNGKLSTIKNLTNK